MSGSRSNVVQIYRTRTPNRPPPANVLREGELAIEMLPPRRLWVGVPTTLDATGRTLLFDASAGYVLEAPMDGATYGRNTGAWSPIDFSVDGGTF